MKTRKTRVHRGSGESTSHSILQCAAFQPKNSVSAPASAEMGSILSLNRGGSNRRYFVAELRRDGVELLEGPSHAAVLPLRPAGVPAIDNVAARIVFATDEPKLEGAVSYTHLTLPTIYSV